MQKLFLAVLALGLAACQTAPDASGSAAGTPEASRTSGGHGAMDHGASGPSSYTDLAFLDGMTHHHQMALDMAALAAERAGSDSVRTLAREILSAQRAEIDTMRAWRARQFPDAPAPGPASADERAAMGMAGMDLNALQAARGAAFDRLFRQQMIPHHAGAITMAAEAQVYSARPEIRSLAEAIVAAQAHEIGEMQAGLDAAPAERSAPADGL